MNDFDFMKELLNEEKMKIRNINQIVGEVQASLRLSGMSLSVHDMLWLYQNAHKVYREETTWNDIVAELITEYTQKEK